MESGTWPGRDAPPDDGIVAEVKPPDIALFCIPGRPAMTGDGAILVAVSAPDLSANIYRGTLVRLNAASSGEPADFTHGPRDS